MIKLWLYTLRFVVDNMLGNRDSGYLYYLLGEIDSKLADIENKKGLTLK